MPRFSSSCAWRSARRLRWKSSMSRMALCLASSDDLSRTISSPCARPVDLDRDGALAGGDEQRFVEARDDAAQGVVVAGGAGRKRAQQGQPPVPRWSRGSTLGVQARLLDE